MSKPKFKKGDDDSTPNKKKKNMPTKTIQGKKI